MRYLALLRGINVGGKNIVKMTDLRLCFECLGLTNVSTYIQSGNVIFESSIKGIPKLSNVIEQAISPRLLKNTQAVVVVSHQQLADIVKKAPPRFGADPTKYRYDVVFLRAPACATDLLPEIRVNPAVDQVFAANGVLYFQRFIAQASKSYLSKIVGTTGYKSMTIRNWNTTAKLYELMSVMPDV